MRTRCPLNINNDEDHRWCRTALHQAAEKNHFHVCQELLVHGAKVRSGVGHNRWPALYAAFEHNHLAVAALLLRSPEVNIKGTALGRSLLCVAAANGHEQLCKTLLDGGATASISALSSAAEKGHEAIVALLLEHNRACINRKDWNGRTALHMAAKHGHLAACQTLIDHGASLHQRDKLNRTALHLAAGRGYVKICQALLDRGAHIQCHDARIETPLARAILRGRPRTQLLLIARGARTNETDAAKRHPTRCLNLTPFQAAAKLGDCQKLVRMFDRDQTFRTFGVRIFKAISFAADPEVRGLLEMQNLAVAARQALTECS